MSASLENIQIASRFPFPLFASVRVSIFESACMFVCLFGGLFVRLNREPLGKQSLLPKRHFASVDMMGSE